MEIFRCLIGREAGKWEYPMHDDSSQDNKEPQERLVIEVTANVVVEMAKLG